MGGYVPSCRQATGKGQRERERERERSQGKQDLYVLDVPREGWWLW